MLMSRGVTIHQIHDSGQTLIFERRLGSFPPGTLLLLVVVVVVVVLIVLFKRLSSDKMQPLVVSTAAAWLWIWLLIGPWLQNLYSGYSTATVSHKVSIPLTYLWIFDCVFTCGDIEEMTLCCQLFKH